MKGPLSEIDKMELHTLPQTVQAESQEDSSFPADGHQVILNNMSKKPNTQQKVFFFFFFFFFLFCFLLLLLVFLENCYLINETVWRLKDLSSREIIRNSLMRFSQTWWQKVKHVLIRGRSHYSERSSYAVYFLLLSWLILIIWYLSSII